MPHHPSPPVRHSRLQRSRFDHANNLSVGASPAEAAAARRTPCDSLSSQPEWGVLNHLEGIYIKGN